MRCVCLAAAHRVSIPGVLRALAIPAHQCQNPINPHGCHGFRGEGEREVEPLCVWSRTQGVLFVGHTTVPCAGPCPSGLSSMRAIFIPDTPSEEHFFLAFRAIFPPHLREMPSQVSTRSLQVDESWIREALWLYRVRISSNR